MVTGNVATELGCRSLGRHGVTSILNCSPRCNALKEMGFISSQEAPEKAQESLLRLL